MLLDGILERNREFVRRREPQALPPAETLQLAVVACYDPRLDSLLLPALGLDQGRVFLLRTAGALVRPGGGVMRSLGLAVFMFGATEILVVGHTSCRMATFRGSEFVDVFRKRGVTREAFGVSDLREWAGAIPSPQRGVRRSVETIASEPYLPRDVTVSGLVLDDATCALEVVVRDLRPGSSVAAPALVEPDAAGAEPAGHPEPEAQPESEEVSRPTDDLGPLVDAIAAVVTQVETQAKWRYEVKNLRQQLSQNRGPVAQFRLLETFLRRVAGDSRDVMQSIEKLRGELAQPDGGAFPRSLARILHRLSGGRS